LAGLLELIRSRDPAKASQAVQNVASKLTYTPDDPEAIAALQGAGSVLEPIDRAFTAAGDWAGENTAEATGSPLLGALARTAPEVLPFDRILGALSKGAKAVRMADGGGAPGGFPTAEGLEVAAPNRRDINAVRVQLQTRMDDAKARNAALRAKMEELENEPRALWDADALAALSEQRSIASSDYYSAQNQLTGTYRDDLPHHPSLDLSTEATDARRIEQGYTQPLYHGTGENRDVRYIDLERLGSRSGGNSASKGFWAAEEPSTADAYAAKNAQGLQGQNLSDMEDALMSGEVRPSEVPGDVWDLADLPGFDESLGRTGGVVLPLWGRPGKNLIHDFGEEGADYGAGMLSKVIDNAWKEGYDSVQFRNIRDDPASSLFFDTNMGNEGTGLQGTHWVFNPANTPRGKFAAFDPELKGANDLSAFNKRKPNVLDALKRDAKGASINSILNYLLQQQQQER
jgi:hypothetical protein